jgi:hypothetical protein
MAERKDTTEYSSSKAPETRVHAEEKDGVKDMRLIPGGATGSPTQQGMAGLHNEPSPNKATGTGTTPGSRKT